MRAGKRARVAQFDAQLSERLGFAEPASGIAAGRSGTRIENQFGAAPGTRADVAGQGFYVSRSLASILFGFLFVVSSTIANADSDFRLLLIDGHTVKWGEPVLGRGATISYAVLDGRSVSGNTNCLRATGIAALLKRSHVTRKRFERELAGALALWQSSADLRFVRAKSVRDADIVFSADADAGGIAFADVTFDRSEVSAISRLKRGIVCLNPDVAWSASHDLGDDSAPGRSATYRLGYTLAHEIGHVLGLDHPGPEGELMSFEYGQKRNGLGQGDIAGITTLYGRQSAVPELALNSKSGPVR